MKKTLSLTFLLLTFFSFCFCIADNDDDSAEAYLNEKTKFQNWKRDIENRIYEYDWQISNARNKTMNGPLSYCAFKSKHPYDECGVEGAEFRFEEMKLIKLYKDSELDYPEELEKEINLCSTKSSKDFSNCYSLLDEVKKDYNEKIKNNQNDNVDNNGIYGDRSLSNSKLNEEIIETFNQIPEEVSKAKEELGTKAAIFESLVPLFKAKDKNTKDNVRALLKTFTQSKDRYTRNIGIYFGYLVQE